MHEWAERAVERGETARRRAADRGGSRRLRARGFDDGGGRARRGRIARRRRRSSIRCRTTSSPATSRPRPGSPASSSISTGTPRPTRTPTRALAVARATGQGELFLVLVQTLGGVWRQRGKLAEAAELLDGGIEAARAAGQHARAGAGASPAAPPPRCGWATWSSRSPPRRRASTSARTPTSSFHSAEAAADLAAALLETGRAGARGRAAPRLRRRRGADAHRREPESPLPRGAHALPGSRSTATPRRERAAALRRGLGLGRAAADGRRLGRPSDGGRRRCTPATRLAQPSRRSRRPPPPTRSARRSRPRCRARSPAARSPKPASVTAPPPSCSARPRELRGARRAALPRRGGARAAQARPSHPPAHARRARPTRPALESLTERELQLARLVVDRKTNPADRRRAVPQPEDGRDAPAQHLPQGRRVVARRARARRRARRPPRSMNAAAATVDHPEGRAALWGNNQKVTAIVQAPTVRLLRLEHGTQSHLARLITVVSGTGALNRDPRGGLAQFIIGLNCTR